MLSVDSHCYIILSFFFYIYGAPPDLHVPTPSFPTLRSSDLRRACDSFRASARPGLRASWRRRHGTGSARRRRLARAPRPGSRAPRGRRSEEYKSELQSIMRITYAVLCVKKKTNNEESTPYETNKIHRQDREKVNDGKT